MRKRRTRYGLLLSLLSLLLCISLMVGATFAWFTDTASTAVNSIQAGTLEIQLQVKRDDQWTDAEGKTIGFVKQDGTPMSDILWEPGATLQLEPVQLINSGNLHVKCVLAITAANGTVSDNGADLSEVIDVFVDGKRIDTLKNVIAMGYDLNPEFFLAPSATESYDTITLQMHPNADNRYQNLSLENLAVSVLATQAPVEYDSTTNQYDSGAQYDKPTAGAVDVWDGTTASVPEAIDGVITITTAAELAGLAQEILNSPYTEDMSTWLEYQDVTIKLAADLDLDNRPWTPIGGFTSDDTGNYTGGLFAGSFDGQGHTISNLRIDPGNDYQGLFGIVSNAIEDIGMVYGPQEIRNLTIHNANVTGEMCVGAFVGNHLASPITFSDLCLTGHVQVTGSHYVGGIVGESNATQGSTLENITVNVNGESFVKSLQSNTSRKAYAGGVAGYLAKADVQNVTSDLDVISEISYVGGIAGVTGVGNWSKVECSGNVTVAEGIQLHPGYYCGLIVGQTNNYAGNNTSGSEMLPLTFTDCTATGTFTVQNSDKPNSNGRDLTTYGVDNKNRFGSWNNSCTLIGF